MSRRRKRVSQSRRTNSRPRESSTPTESPSAQEAIERIIATRTADLCEAANQAFARRAKQDPDFQAAFPRLRLSSQRSGPHTTLRWTWASRTASGSYDWNNVRAFLALTNGPTRSEFRRVLALFVSHRTLVDNLVPRLMRILPSLTQKQFLLLLKEAWPATRGVRRPSLFSRPLIHSAYEALLRENKSWGARAAKKELADSLGVSSRTIDYLLAPARLRARSRNN